MKTALVASLPMASRSPWRALRAGTALALFSTVGLAGCISAQSYKNTMSEQITHMPVRAPIDANVGLEVHHGLAPRMRAAWKAWLNGDREIANYEQAVTDLLREEVVSGRLFSGTFLGGATTSDLIVSVASAEDKDDDNYWVLVTLTVMNPQTRAPLATYRRQQVTATSMFSHKPLKVIPRLVASIGEEMRPQVPRLVATVRQGEIREVAKACEQADDLPTRLSGCTELIARAAAVGRTDLQATAYVERASVYLQRRDLDRASADVDQALRLDSRQIWAHYYRGRIAESRRQYERAARDFDATASLIEASVAAKPDARLRDSGVSIRNRAWEMEARAGMEQKWVEYLKAIQASQEYENWSAPPYDLYRQGQR
jgi:hypothetical protein